MMASDLLASPAFFGKSKWYYSPEVAQQAVAS
jgi:hypothetical protein